ncbi:TPA: hypothetical protein ACIIU1_004878, partial [Escherichia coli]
SLHRFIASSLHRFIASSLHRFIAYQYMSSRYIRKASAERNVGSPIGKPSHLINSVRYKTGL